MLAVAVFPALSVQEPVTVPDDGPEYVAGAVHDAMPENELPPKETATGWLYQPLESGERAGFAVADGAEVSTWSVNENALVCVDEPFQVAVQVSGGAVMMSELYG